MHGAEASNDQITTITDRVMEGLGEWQNRPLDAVYPVIFIDWIHVKVRDGQVANLYRCVSDVEAIVVAWHERQVSNRLDQLSEAVATAEHPRERLQVVVRTFADLSAGRHQPGSRFGHGPELAVPLHRGEHMHPGSTRLRTLLADVIHAPAEVGLARSDVPADELATFRLHALAATAELTSRAARQRLAELTSTQLVDDRHPATDDDQIEPDCDSPSACTY